MAQKMRDSAGTYLHELRDAGERAWERTQRVVVAAGTRTAQYAKVVQRRLDLASVDRKMEVQYRELGRLVFAAARAGTSEVLLHPEIRAGLARLGELDEERRHLAGEIETLQAAAMPSQDTDQSQEQGAEAASDPRTDEEEERQL